MSDDSQLLDPPLGVGAHEHPGATSRQQPPARDRASLSPLLFDDWLETFQQIFPSIVAQELAVSGQFKNSERLLANFQAGRPATDKHDFHSKEGVASIDIYGVFSGVSIFLGGR